MGRIPDARSRGICRLAAGFPSFADSLLGVSALCVAAAAAADTDLVVLMEQPQSTAGCPALEEAHIDQHMTHQVGREERIVAVGWLGEVLGAVVSVVGIDVGADVVVMNIDGSRRAGSR